jgi:hypothetical protein
MRLMIFGYNSISDISNFEYKISKSAERFLGGNI